MYAYIVNERNEENIRRAQKKIFRTIIKPTKLNEEEYRRRTIVEIKVDCGDDIVKEIKVQRAKWYIL